MYHTIKTCFLSAISLIHYVIESLVLYQETLKTLLFWTGYGGRKLQRNFSLLPLKHASACFLNHQDKFTNMPACMWICSDKDMEPSARIESNPRPSSDTSSTVKLKSYSFRKRNTTPRNHNGGRSVGRSVSFQHPISSGRNPSSMENSPDGQITKSFHKSLSLDIPQVCVVLSFCIPFNGASI